MVKKVHFKLDRRVHRRSLCKLTPIKVENWVSDWNLVTCIRCLKLMEKTK